MSDYKAPRPLSIAVTNQKQYLLGHKRGWDDAQVRISELEDKLLAMQIQSNDFIGSLETKIFQFQHHVNRINGKGGDL